MTTPTATPERINFRREFEGPVAVDTVDLLAARVVNLFSHGRRVAVATRFTHLENDLELATGLAVAQMDRWTRPDTSGLRVQFTPGLLALGFSAQPGADHDTERHVRRRYFSGDRANMTYIAVTGGLPDDGPAGDDKIVIRHWYAAGGCRQITVVFDQSAANRHATDLALAAKPLMQAATGPSYAGGVYDALCMALGWRGSLEADDVDEAAAVIAARLEEAG